MSGWIMAQKRSMVTATSEKMELVQSSSSSEFIRMHAWKFSGLPTLTVIAHGIPSSPEMVVGAVIPAACPGWGHHPTLEK